MEYYFSEDFNKELQKSRSQDLYIFSLDLWVLFNNLFFEKRNIEYFDIYYRSFSNCIDFVTSSLKNKTSFLHKKDLIEIYKNNEKIYEGKADKFLVNSKLLEENDSYVIKFIKPYNLNKSVLLTNSILLNQIPFLMFRELEPKLSLIKRVPYFELETSSFSDIFKYLSELNTIAPDTPFVCETISAYKKLSESKKMCAFINDISNL